MNVELSHEASEYIKAAEATAEERLEILAWIKDGNSIYDNPWHMADDKGQPMDYISALRGSCKLNCVNSKMIE